MRYGVVWQGYSTSMLLRRRRTGPDRTGPDGLDGTGRAGLGWAGLGWVGLRSRPGWGSRMGGEEGGGGGGFGHGLLAGGWIW